MRELGSLRVVLVVPDPHTLIKACRVPSENLAIMKEPNRIHATYNLLQEESHPSCVRWIGRPHLRRP